MKNYADPSLEIIVFSAKEILADDIDFSIITCTGAENECDDLD